MLLIQSGNDCLAKGVTQALQGQFVAFRVTGFKGHSLALQRSQQDHDPFGQSPGLGRIWTVTPLFSMMLPSLG